MARLKNREEMIDTLNSLPRLDSKHILLSKLAVIEICPDGQRKNIFELELGQDCA